LPSGAYGANRDYELGKTNKWYIELQRYAFDTIGAGLALKDKSYIDKGIHFELGIRSGAARWILPLFRQFSQHGFLFGSGCTYRAFIASIGIWP
jgi:hypothetical protein